MLRTLRRDLRTARDRDPAARSSLEVALCYPGVHALWAYRVNHWLWGRGMALPARVGATVARTLTGVEIHPAAVIGDGVFIDHATGVVIGETAEVGNDVTIYHGVTLGGTSLEPTKRHPTIGDRVVIGAGAKVLGGFTVGADSRIGANAVVVRAVPPGSVVVGVPGQVITRSRPRPAHDEGMPDLVGLSLQSLLTRVDRLEAAAHTGAGDAHRDPNGTRTTIHPPKGGVWQGEDFAI
ncbi:serine O-acetyltransferase [Frankia sp. AgKG'84/4]|uniref:serine O-acetyltransferase n=1 Tax=Frankia sp. AgKG'84/4 TaxID=573490 RepID=UPI00200E6C5A|nr:serine O-acetyltransferase [Frankia sp. AgKG'84/4]MCL9794570.1 serine O-acetyltransferase [Frankia sp. AgKG'84/4]